MMRLTTAAILGSALLAQSARSAETITYTYDAHGRIIQVVRTGAVNNNVTYTYEHDQLRLQSRRPDRKPDPRQRSLCLDGPL
jgi:YD repeat-containing protein